MSDAQIYALAGLIARCEQLTELDGDDPSSWNDAGPAARPRLSPPTPQNQRKRREDCEADASHHPPPTPRAHPVAQEHPHRLPPGGRTMTPEWDYLGWDTPSHGAGCARRDWQLRVRREESPSGRMVVVVQAVCPQDGGCGTYHSWTLFLPPETDADFIIASGPTSRIGYGCHPLRRGGVWLHPGPPLLPSGGTPLYYVVTRSSRPPVRWWDILGVISEVWREGRRVDLWSAQILDPYGSDLGAVPRAIVEVPSIEEAVAWVLEQNGQDPDKTGPPAGDDALDLDALRRGYAAGRQCRAVLEHALGGITLDERDRRFIGRIASQGGATVDVVCSWLDRARQAGRMEAADG